MRERRLLGLDAPPLSALRFIPGSASAQYDCPLEDFARVAEHANDPAFVVSP